MSVESLKASYYLRSINHPQKKKRKKKCAVKKQKNNFGYVYHQALPSDILPSDRLDGEQVIVLSDLTLEENMKIMKKMIHSRSFLHPLALLSSQLRTGSDIQRGR